MLKFDFMKQKPKLNNVYFMYISLQSHYAEAKMKQAKKPMKPMKQAVSSILTSFLLILNEGIKIFQLKKLANQFIFNDAFMVEMISNSFYESKNNFFMKKRRTDDEKDEFQRELKKVFGK